MIKFILNVFSNFRTEKANHVLSHINLMHVNMARTAKKCILIYQDLPIMKWLHILTTCEKEESWNHKLALG